MEISWTSHGMPWKSHVNPMEIPWKSHGNPMESTWNPTEILWKSHRNSMESQGNPMEIPWKSYGIPWKSHGNPMEILWNPMEIPWKSLRILPARKLLNPDSKENFFRARFGPERGLYTSVHRAHLCTLASVHKCAPCTLVYTFVHKCAPCTLVYTRECTQVCTVHTCVQTPFWAKSGADFFFFESCLNSFRAEGCARISMGFQWAFHRISVGFPLDFHGIPMRFMRFPMGFP